MSVQIIIANIINFLAGMCSITSVQGKNKKQIIFIEFLGTILRIISNFLVKSWSDLIAKIIKGTTQVIALKSKLNKTIFYLVSLIYISICLTVTYFSKDLRCLVAIIPSIMEFYSLLVSSTKKYRWYIVITKMFWIVNNILFQLYVGIIFDLITMIGHLLKIKNIKKRKK